ncbi:hypothetical protein AAFF_G00186980 [Aldrovandia affinis]|uniref:Uncharacterized protein n=1 Tax=Aldrovandia affinis TaxID=143900 RepID=A0AAD7WV71_9TELE|nr:hypothetical protein AAFF_G00186980 [Aldrovandia affinis]
MEQTLHLLHKSADTTGKVLEEPPLGLTIRNGEFTDQQMGLSDKIPLVKPYFKKKHAQRKLDTKCLRALDDPILTTLLNSDALVAGDGVFVPRNQPGTQRNLSNLCAAVVGKQSRMNQVCLKDDTTVSGLIADEGEGEIADPTTELVEQGQKVTDIQRVTIATNEHRFQPQACDVTAPIAVVSPCEGGKMNDMYSSEPLQGANCLAIKDGPLKGEIFQDKSEEASLDLVFELLTQLQYHTHQGDAVSICVDFLQGVCVYGSDCGQHHTVLPYHWQIRSAETQIWQSMSDDSQEQLERLYCNPDNEQVRLKFQGRVFTLDFAAKRSGSGWREYSEPVVRLIEEANQEKAAIPLQRDAHALLTDSGWSGLTGPLPLAEPRAPPPVTYLVHGAQGLPETWLPMGSCQDFVQVPVSKEDRSYRTVYSLFHKTVSETRFRILKILRVQNAFLWEKYKRKKEYMSRKMSEMDRMLNERHLFHGTSHDAVEGICKHNFDPRVCGKHATMFGQGSYFARKAIYSHNFSKRSSKGVHCMFLAKVLTGKFTVGNATMRRPPPLHAGDSSSDLFDSCVDNWVDPQIFVIFNDDQSYPYFIIQYEEVSNTASISRGPAWSVVSAATTPVHPSYDTRPIPELLPCSETGGEGGRDRPAVFFQTWLGIKQELNLSPDCPRGIIAGKQPHPLAGSGVGTECREEEEEEDDEEERVQTRKND